MHGKVEKRTKSPAILFFCVCVEICMSEKFYEEGEAKKKKKSKKSYSSNHKSYSMGIEMDD